MTITTRGKPLRQRVDQSIDECKLHQYGATNAWRLPLPEENIG